MNINNNNNEWRLTKEELREINNYSKIKNDEAEKLIDSIVNLVIASYYI